MRFRVSTVFTAVAAMLALSSCGAGSPDSAKELGQAIEKLGYECTQEDDLSGEGATLDCGEGLTATWFDDPASEAESHALLAKVLDNGDITLYVTRSGQWRVSGHPDPVQKVAEALDTEVSVLQ